MVPDPAMSPCATCGCFAPIEVLAEAAWLPAEVAGRLAPEACPACCHAALASWLTERAEEAGSAGLLPFRDDGRLIPYGALPSWLQLGADPRATGRGGQAISWTPPWTIW